MVDADNFKKINDTYGHGEGDEALKAFGRALSASVRANRESGPDMLFRSRKRSLGSVFRLGGDEFLVLSGDDIDLASACHVASDIPGRIAAEGAGMPYQLSASVGGAYSMGLIPKEVLLEGADQALYTIKNDSSLKGKGHAAVWTPDRGILMCLNGEGVFDSHGRRVELKAVG